MKNFAILKVLPTMSTLKSHSLPAVALSAPPKPRYFHLSEHRNNDETAIPPGIIS